MYRPGTEPQYRPRGAVPPPPPPGMTHYVPARQMPPPIHGRPYTTTQFSYAGPPPPPTASHMRSFPSLGLPLQPPPPSIHVPPFVPPLPADLPPPPPPSPPPSPPLLPSETSLASDLQPQHVAQDRQREDASSATVSESKGHSESNTGPRFYNDLQQNYSLPHLQSEAENESIRHADSKNDLAQLQQHSDWNATYQDTLDEEAGSPATSDMDMDMEGSSSAPSRRGTRYPEGSRGNVHRHISGSSNTPEGPHSTGAPYSSVTKQLQMNVDDTLYGARYALVHTVPHALDEVSLACPGIEQAVSIPKERRTSRLSRWGSPPPLQPVQVVNESQSNDDYHLLAGSREKPEHLDIGGDAIDTSRDIQGPNIAASTNGEVSMDLETPVTFGGTVDIHRDLQRPISTNPTGERRLMTDTVLESTQQQEHKKGPTVDEFGRLVHEAASDSEPEGVERHLPVDEFGRVVQRRGASWSESEGDRRPSKRKRSYTRSRSRSRSRGRSRGRSTSRSTSRGRSRSRSTSSSRSRRRSSSRSPTRSSGEIRRRRRSFSRSPRRKMRWSRSRSRSPQWRRSYSRTPPRDMRWGGSGRGERDWRGDREYFGRGRRGGRGRPWRKIRVLGGGMKDI